MKTIKVLTLPFHNKTLRRMLQIKLSKLKTILVYIYYNKICLGTCT